MITTTDSSDSLLLENGIQTVCHPGKELIHKCCRLWSIIGNEALNHIQQVGR
jgi:hypothetical protein